MHWQTIRAGVAITLLALAAGCVPGGGRGGGGRDDDGGRQTEGDGMLDGDAEPAGDMFVDPDDGVPPPDMAPDPDDGVPPSDADIPEPDMESCEPQPETCDGADDDCDGEIDEDFTDLGDRCEVGMGRCQQVGARVCAPDGGGTVCDAEAGAPAEEQCDGQDHDCDGAVDEAPLCEALAAPECTRAVQVADPERNIGQDDLGHCDTPGNSDLPFDTWIRFVPPAGEQLPEAPPEPNTCGTDAPGWLESGHPAVADGVVEGTVCFHYFNDPCNWTTEVQVRNCGDFYVYRLPEAPNCRLQYCVE